MYCNNCGANVPEGLSYCPSCGVRLDQFKSQQNYQNQQPYQGLQYPQDTYEQPYQGLQYPQDTYEQPYQEHRYSQDTYDQTYQEHRYSQDTYDQSYQGYHYPQNTSHQPQGLQYPQDTYQQTQQDYKYQQQVSYTNDVNGVDNAGVYTSPAPQKKIKINWGKSIVSTIVSVSLVLGVPYIFREVKEQINRNSGSAASAIYEECAIRYADCIFVTEDEVLFEDSLAIDLVGFTDDVIGDMCTEAGLSKEEFYSYLSLENDSLISDAASVVALEYKTCNQRIRDLTRNEFGSANTDFAVKDCTKLNVEELQKIYDDINAIITQTGHDISSYLDKALVSEAYKININCIFDEIMQSEEYYSYDDINVYVINYNGEYKVLYDDIVFNGFLEAWLSEE